MLSDDEDADGRPEGLPPEDVEAMRAALLDMLADNEDLANLDERLAAMIAQIVEAYGRYNSSRGPSYSSYQALKAMSLDDLEGRLLAGLLAPYGDEPTPTQEQIAKALAAQRIAQLRKMVEAETKRRTAEQLGREHVQMYGVPQLAENVEFLRASGEQLRQMRRVVAPLARTLATRLAARRRRSRAGEIDLRKTLRKSMSTGGVPIDVVLKKPHPARPELVVLCDVSGSVAGFSHFTLLLVHALRQQFSRVRVFAFIDTTDEVTELFGPDADLAVAVQRITREAGVYTRDGHSDYGHAFVSFLDKWPERAVAAQLAAGARRRAQQLPQPRDRPAGPHGQRQQARALAQPRAQAPVGQRRLGGAALRGRHHHARVPVGQAARRGDRPAAAGLIAGRAVAAPVSWLFVASRRRLGVMGGTFDPIHNGHLVAASEVADLFDLDEVVFVPTGQPWQKRDRDVTAAEDRYLMTVIATASNPRFSVSRVDIDRGGPTYTKDTLRDLRALNPDAELYFITGADALASILSWQNWEELFAHGQVRRRQPARLRARRRAHRGGA